MKRDWSKEFNALPEEVRIIGSALELKIRMQHLLIEKDRIKKRYRQSLREIDDHTKNCKEWLVGLEK